MLNEQEFPSESDRKRGVEPTQVFSPWSGKDFIIEISSKGNYPNYEKCGFSSRTSPIKIDGIVIDKNNQEHRKLFQEKVINQLTEVAEEMEKFGYKKWTNEQEEEVKKACAFYLGKNVSVEQKSNEIEKFLNKEEKGSFVQEMKVEEEEEAYSDNSYMDDELSDLLNEI
jgi:hypothetical protein